MEDIIKELQSEVSELKSSLKMSIKLNEKLVEAVDDLRSKINSMNSNKVISEEEKMENEVMKGFGLI